MEIVLHTAFLNSRKKHIFVGQENNSIIKTYRFMKIKSLLFAAVIAVAALVGCDKEKNPSGGKAQKPVTDIAKLEYQEGMNASVLAQVVAVGKDGYILADKSGYLYVYGTTNVTAGSTYLVEGVLTKYGTILEMKDATATATEVSLGISAPTYAALTGEEVTSIMASRTVVATRPVSLTAFLYIASSQYVNLTIPGTEIVGSLKIKVADASKFADKTVAIKGFITGTATRIDFMPVDIQIVEGAAPMIASVSPTDLEFTSDGGEKTVEVTVSAEGGEIVPSFDNEHFTATVDGTKVTVIAPVSTEEERATLTIGLKYEGKIVSSKEVTIYQEAPHTDGQKKVSIDFSAKGYSNGTSLTEVTEKDITIAFAKGSNTYNAPKYYTEGASIRCYAGNTMTVSGGTIKKIVLFFGSDEKNNEITASVGAFETGTWEGDAASVTFTISGETGHRRIQKMNVFYTVGGETGGDTGGETGDDSEGGETGGETGGENGGNTEGGDDPVTPPAQQTETKTWSYTFANKKDLENLTDVTVNNLSWTQEVTFSDPATPYWATSNEKGVTIGKAASYAEYFALKTSAVPGTIKKVKVTAQGASGTAAKLNVSVGDIAYGTQQTITNAAADYVFEGTSSGELVVSFTQGEDSKKAIYLRTIEITYEVPVSNQ